MRMRWIVISTIALIMISACSSAPAVTPAATGTAGNMGNEKAAVTIEPHGSAQWVIRASRECGGAAASAEVIIRLATQPGAAQPPHAGLAGAKAFLSIAQAHAQAGKSTNAVECAQAGLDELGTRYIALGDDDDTDVKLRAARERIAAGAVGDGAAVMVRVLQTRIALYEALHAADFSKQ